MAGNDRPPWETSQWRSFHQLPPSPEPSAKKKSIGVFGVLAIAAGVGIFGYFVLDGHQHTCESCGRRWRHLGAFNFGDPAAHTCTCGTVQWWKDGFQHVFRDPSQPQYGTPPPPPSQYGAPLSQYGAPPSQYGAPSRQEIREVPYDGLPSRKDHV